MCLIQSIIRLQQRKIKQHQAILLICKSASFGYQRIAMLCTFCLLINTLMAVQGTVSLQPIHMMKITFFEEKKFLGRCYNCSSDCADLRTYFSSCNSIRVESGVWVIYERPKFKGFQCILGPGEYADSQQWMAFTDGIKSCRVIKNVHGSAWKLRLYERPDFGGQMMECSDDCPSVYDTYKMREIYSCVVSDGAWVFYDLPNYKGHQYLLEPGEYRQHSDWEATSPGVGSFRRITEL